MAQYIDKDAVVAEIENLLDKGKYHEEYDCAYRDGNNGALYALKEKVNNLEVKEVDLEKEIDNYISDNFFGSETLGFFANRTKEEPNDIDMALCAKHFFELGLKAQKGEEV